MNKNYSQQEGNILDSMKDKQSITFDWQKLQKNISGVINKQVAHVIKDSGYLTEIFRKEWFEDNAVVEHIFQVILNPSQISGWHSHQYTTDRLFVTHGTMKIVLYDSRTESPTYRMVNEFRFGLEHPAMVIVPPGIWHAIQNISILPATILNCTDHPYEYENPDHWRLPIDTDKIPYSFEINTKKT